MKDSPEGQTHSCSQEEEVRAALAQLPDIPYKTFDKGFALGYKAALASQAEQVKAAETRSRIDAANANSVVKQLAQANTTIAALQARIEAADKQEPWIRVGVMNGRWAELTQSECDTCDGHVINLYKKPPITSERELELLAVIEQLGKGGQK